MVLRVEVMPLSGDSLCVKDMDRAWTGRDLKRWVSEASGFCTCRIDLRASSFRVEMDTPMQEIIRRLRPNDHECVLKKWLQEDYESTLDITVKKIEDRNILDLHEDGICIKCMIDPPALIPLVDILSCLKEIDANMVFAARVPLKDVLQARHQSTRRHQLYGHPPVTEYTMFDSQLQSAGYTATDFRSAGFTAQDLSSKYFWRFASTAGEQEWAETCAFFDASALKEAGFNAIELLHACFSIEDLREAGFPECELPRAKSMPKPTSCRSKSYVARHVDVASDRGDQRRSRRSRSRHSRSQRNQTAGEGGGGQHRCRSCETPFTSSGFDSEARQWHLASLLCWRRFRASERSDQSDAPHALSKLSKPQAHRAEKSTIG